MSPWPIVLFTDETMGVRRGEQGGICSPEFGHLVKYLVKILSFCVKILKFGQNTNICSPLKISSPYKNSCGHPWRRLTNESEMNDSHRHVLFLDHELLSETGIECVEGALGGSVRQRESSMLDCKYKNHELHMLRIAGAEFPHIYENLIGNFEYKFWLRCKWSFLCFNTSSNIQTNKHAFKQAFDE